jgi:hypothetical protein
MDASQLALLVTSLVLGSLVILSYVYLLKTTRLDQLWAGISLQNQYVYYVFMILAALGFIAFVCWYCFDRSDKSSKSKKSNSDQLAGLFASKLVVPVLVGILLASSALWSLFLSLASNRANQPVWRVMTSVTLVVTAICSILLVAGTVECRVAKWYALAGILCFGLTTVLADAVGWQASYILSNKTKLNR